MEKEDLIADCFILITSGQKEFLWFAETDNLRQTKTERKDLGWGLRFIFSGLDT